MNAGPVRIIAVLTVVAILSGLGLAKSYQYADPLIQQNKLEELKKAIFLVLPEAESRDEIPKNDLILYRGKDADGREVGYAFIWDGGGFQGKIRLMIGLHPDLKTMSGLEVLESVETPGLGAKIMGEPFRSQFQGLSVVPQVKYIKNRKPSEEKPSNVIDAITGATISSEAVVNILNAGIAQVVPIIEGGV